MLTLTVFAGCDAHVDQDYPGEPLGKIQGQVTNSRDGQTPALEVVLMWPTGEDGDDINTISTTAPITGEFPAKFELTLYTPPPEAAMYYDPESGADFTLGVIVAMPEGVESGESFDFESKSQQIQGVAPGHVLIYCSAPVAAGTELAAFVGGPVSAGYHLRRVDVVPQDKVDAILACREAAEATCWDEFDDVDCNVAIDACGSTHARIVPASQDESISLILGSFEEIPLPELD
jgi:hypothetical protein